MRDNFMGNNSSVREVQKQQSLFSQKNIQPQKLFQLIKRHFKVPSHIFEEKRNIYLQQLEDSKINIIGGLPHFKPLLGYRFGIKASGLYEEGNDTWLKEEGSLGQWAYGYYGIQNKKQDASERQKSNLVTCFLLQSDPKLKRKKQQLYSTKIYKEVDLKYRNLSNLNKRSCIQNNFKLGKGIQITPHYEKALLKTFLNQQMHQNFYVIFECRFDPRALRIPESSSCVWVLPQLKYIRFTGMIVYTLKQYNKIKERVRCHLFPYKEFIWECFEKGYQQFFNPSLVKKIDLRKLGNTSNLTILNLAKDKNSEALNVNDMKQLVKANLDNLKQLNLKKNIIGNQGLQVLANKQLERLQKIELNNNNISIRGIKFLLETKWNKDASVQLKSVRQTDSNGYFIEMDKNISIIKQIHQSIPINIFNLIERKQEQQQKQLFHSMNLLFQIKNCEYSNDVLQQSKRIETKLQKQFIEAIKNDNISLSVALKILKEDYLNDTTVIYSQKSTVFSQLCCGIICKGMMDERIKFTHKIHQNQWEYDTITKDDEQLQKYLSWYKQKIKNQFGLSSTESIIVHQISKGSIIHKVSIQSSQICNLNNNFMHSKNIQIIPFFEGFQLSPNDFDMKGDYQFPQIVKAQTHERGGIPYYQPVLGKRYGLNIESKYDGGSNQWLAMNGCQGEWAVGFHGVKRPHQSLKKIMQGRQKGEMLIPGPRQLYQNDYAINRTNNLIGAGIYFSPHFETCLQQYAQTTSIKDYKYKVILQCRLKPGQIMISNRQDYWIVQKSKDVRPYGIVLFTQDQHNQIKKYLQDKRINTVHKQFDWKHYQANFNNFHDQK